jgi:malate synthase
VLPDRAQVTMTVPFMRAYTELLVQDLPPRGAHAIGGMAAFIPSRATRRSTSALAKVREDKEREAGDGFDGTWVAHPDLVPIATESSTRARRPAEPARPQRDDVGSTADSCSTSPRRRATITEARGCATTSASASSTSSPGCGGNGAAAITT